MRRKSSRSAAKASPEKPTEPTRRSRRHSKRRKRSSSGSSDDDDSNDVPLQALVTKSVEVPKEIVVPSVDEPPVEESVWKVTPSAAPSGEIQKLKICLTRPVMSSPEKNEPTSRRRRNKSGNEEDVTSSEDVVVMPRKSRYRGSLGKNLDESGVELEDNEEKKGKGKSKSKTKSQKEKSQELQESEDRIESEISENVQVTPQSPQAAIDIRVDNETMSNNENDCVINEESNSVSQTSEICDATQEEFIQQSSKSTDEPSCELNEPVAQVKEPTVQPLVATEEPIAISSESSSPKIIEEQPELEVANEERLQRDGVETEQPEPVEDTAVEVPEIVTSQEASEAAQEELEGVEVIKTAANAQAVIEHEAEASQVVSDDKEEPKQSDEAATEERSNLAEDLSAKAAQEEVQARVEVEEVTEHAQHGEDAVKKVTEHVKEDVTAHTQQVVDKTSHAQEIEVIKKVERSEVIEKVEQSEVIEKAEQSEVIEKAEQSEVIQKAEQFEVVSHGEKHNHTEKSETEDLHRSVNDESKSGGTSSDEADKEESDNQVLILQSKDIIDDSSMKSPPAKDKLPSKDEKPAVTESTKKEPALNLNRTSIIDNNKKPNRKRKWGKSSIGLGFVKPLINNIDIETIKQLCPDLQFLEETELKIDISDLRKSMDNDRKSTRKVSIEHKSNDVENRRLSTQTSFKADLPEVDESVEQEVDNSNIIAMNRKISIVDDTASKLKPPPSPAKNPVSSILFISNLVRPFTLKQLKELLERTGKLTESGFWTDRIKSKCYVCYESNEEAEATRNALHGVHWPIGNGKKLVIDYSTAEDMERARNPTPPPVIPQVQVPDTENIENQSLIKKSKLVEEDKYGKESEPIKVEKRVREWDIGKEDMQRLRSRSRERDGRHDRHERNDRRKHKRTPSPIEDFISRKQKKKEEEIPQKLMDDLFQKTKATPSIYWLPLTPDEIATKQQQRLLRMAEHKRRIEESNRNRGDYGRGAPYRRRYNN